MATSLLLSNSLHPFPYFHKSKFNLGKGVEKFPYSNKPTIVRPFKIVVLDTPTGLVSYLNSGKVRLLAVGQKTEKNDTLVGEDSAEFDLSKQRISSWVYFAGVLGVVLFILNVVWIDNSTGFGKDFISAVSSLSQSHESIVAWQVSETKVRSSWGNVLTVSYLPECLFHWLLVLLYDGVQLWELQNVPWLHHVLWLTNFISFFFLYPSTFNLLEVAAVDKPKMHLWETGIMRITRHPQMVGQVMWCLAHTVWIGNSVTVAASVGLIGHHLFGVWNGDRRLAIRYGEDFEVVKSRTSVIPFAAIIEGRQKLPKDYYKEFIRLPYLTITALTLGAYFAHPLMQAASYGLRW
ncbi:OLC1v1018797C1 [Oldenlandia corymbosa var. corymbosa]|uniref:OLC1v1018797C1 n=1 Tax=Oldenlandia corymbosa var. corymbosa TaxID=529605 RepID=A0AAV1ECE6_OLDCO|nr:OLC1v1018797C1 [Oldenlandia corymbosa var. corymbosa]